MYLVWKTVKTIEKVSRVKLKIIYVQQAKFIQIIIKYIKINGPKKINQRYKYMKIPLTDFADLLS